MKEVLNKVKVHFSYKIKNLKLPQIIFSMMYMNMVESCMILLETQTSVKLA